MAAGKPMPRSSLSSMDNGHGGGQTKSQRRQEHLLSVLSAACQIASSHPSPSRVFPSDVTAESARAAASGSLRRANSAAGRRQLLAAMRRLRASEAARAEEMRRAVKVAMSRDADADDVAFAAANSSSEDCRLLLPDLGGVGRHQGITLCSLVPPPQQHPQPRQANRPRVEVDDSGTGQVNSEDSNSRTASVGTKDASDSPVRQETTDVKMSPERAVKSARCA